MNQEINQQRLQNIYQMLMEMASGNFSYRIPRTANDDELEVLTVLVNWLAEELKEGVFHLGYINPHAAYHYVVQSTCILNPAIVITDFSRDIPDLLGLEAATIAGRDFDKILSSESVPIWKAVVDKLQQEELNHTTLRLIFATSENLVIDTFCSVSKLLATGQIIVSLFNAAPVEIGNGQEKEMHNHQNVQLIQSVYDYVLNYNGGHFPTLKELARIFGTNENKLKMGFRHFFNTSIYHFYYNERLNRALYLIRFTSIPLKNIAIMIGYSTYPNFSKAFKIKFGYSPTNLERNPSSPNDNPILP